MNRIEYFLEIPLDHVSLRVLAEVAVALLLDVLIATKSSIVAKDLEVAFGVNLEVPLEVSLGMDLEIPLEVALEVLEVILISVINLTLLCGFLWYCVKKNI